MIADTAIGMLLAAATLLPLAWKWHLGLRRAAVAIVALAIAAGVLTGVADLGSTLDPVPGSVVVWILTVIAGSEFKLKYAGSIFGYAWSVIKPLALFTVLYLVFARVFKPAASHAGMPNRRSTTSVTPERR